MNKLIPLAFLFFISLNTNAQLSAGEKLGLKLDSLAKAYDIKLISVYFHVGSTKISDMKIQELNKTFVESYLIDEYNNFKFEGQFIIFTDNNDKDVVRYYNLEKLIHFTASKGKNIRVYFQM